MFSVSLRTNFRLWDCVLVSPLWQLSTPGLKVQLQRRLLQLQLRLHRQQGGKTATTTTLTLTTGNTAKKKTDFPQTFRISVPVPGGGYTRSLLLLLLLHPAHGEQERRRGQLENRPRTLDSQDASQGTPAEAEAG